MNVPGGVWLSINDYSRYKNVSVSTIRRHIKNNILKYREEGGKYLIYVHSLDKVKVREEEETLKLKLEIELLKTQLRDLRDENNELRMLVEVYETEVKTSVADLPPDLPVQA